MDRVHQDRYQEYIEFDQESRFASAEEVKCDTKHIDLQAEFYDEGGIPLLANCKEAYVDTADHHNLILGSTGSGKTRRLILILINILLRSPGSLIIVDVKGMLRRMTSGLAKRMGKKVISLDMKEFRHGECWNPLEEPAKLYYEGHREQACELFADFMDGLAAAQEQNTKDIFFVGMAKSFGNAILQTMAECLPLSMNNVANFVELCSESNYEAMVEFSRLMSYSSKTATAFRGIYSAAEKTRQSIEVSLYEMIRLFSTNERMTRMLSKSTFDIHEIACGNCVVYIEIADEKPTYHAIASMFIKQVYEILVRDAQGKPEERLPNPVYFIIDEFGNIPRIENMSNIITAARSRNIFCTLVVQSYHQLRRIYGHDAETIKANCQNWFYLFSRELSMLNEISELCGDIRTAEGGVRRLISVSELQRFKMGEMLVMHDRLYPYVTYMPDISEYRLKSYPEISKKEIEAQYNEIVKIENLIRKIQVGDFPVPFKCEIPAIRQVMERTAKVGLN